MSRRVMMDSCDRNVQYEHLAIPHCNLGPTDLKMSYRRVRYDRSTRMAVIYV
jgi:hypothetical protein